MPFKLENKDTVRAAVGGLGGINKIEVKSIFGNADLLQSFRSYCRFEESEENILFLQAIRAFKQSGGKGNIAYQIKKKFLRPEIKGAVNLKDSTLKPWKEKNDILIDEANEEGFSVKENIFDKLYEEIEILLDTGTVMRFRQELAKAF